MIQGVPIPCSIDLTELGVFSDIIFELYQTSTKNVVGVARYLNPSENEYPIIKNGNIYSFTYPSSLTELLLGDYGIEMTYFDADGEIIDKAQTSGITIEQETK